MKPRLEEIHIRIQNKDGTSTAGILFAEVWEGKAATFRAVRILGKAFGAVLALCCLALFVHILVIPSLVLLTAAVIGGPILFFTLRTQGKIISQVKAECPNCNQNGALGTYLHLKVEDKMTLLCRQCGQTCSADLVTEAQVEVPL